MKRILNVFLLLIFAFLFQNCGTTPGAAKLYSEESISPDKISIGTVAILPNRLPLNLQNPEKWRQFNYEVIKRNFQSHGYRVIDYSTGNDFFLSSGLPLEDTKSSRDKYAELAEKLNADILIFPYYGMSYSMTGCMYIANHNFIGLGSLQFYVAGENDFFARLDFDGRYHYNNILNMIPIVGWIAILSNSAESNYEKAFDIGISNAINQFFDKYKRVYTQPVNKSTEPTSTNPYDKYSKQELEQMKTKAVQDKDFKKAAEIKAELDKRN